MSLIIYHVYLQLLQWRYCLLYTSYLYGCSNLINSLSIFNAYSFKLSIVFTITILYKLNISPFFRYNSLIYIILPYFLIFIYTLIYFIYISIYLDILNFIYLDTFYSKYILLIFSFMFFFLFNIKKTSDFIFFSSILFIIQFILIF